MNLQPLRISAIRHETPALAHVELAAPAEYLEAYHMPGQYVQAWHGANKPGFFAIASAPHERRIELLLKKGAPLADAIRALSPGGEVAISPPQGKGFPLEEATGRDAILAGVGSGMAPLRALMREMLARRGEFGRITFLYGARTSEAIPYQSEVRDWAAHGVDVMLSCSRPAAGTWEGPTGYIQHMLRSRQPVLAARTAVFVCGMQPMVEALKQELLNFGLPASRVFQNL